MSHQHTTRNIGSTSRSNQRIGKTPMREAGGEKGRSGQSTGSFVHISSLKAEMALREEERRRRWTGSSSQDRPQKKTCRFGKTELPILEENDPTGYRPLEYLPVDTQQKSLLDAIWKASSRKAKLDACCALQFYFSKILEPPMGKNYSFYALCTGNRAGVYCQYSSLLQAKAGLDHAHWKGFYSFNDALDYVWDHLSNPEQRVFIEDKPKSEAQILDLQAQIKDKTAECERLAQQLAKALDGDNSSTEEQVETHSPTTYGIWCAQHCAHNDAILHDEFLKEIRRR